MPPVERLRPPENGVTVRMYRQGHGDCFLIAFPREDGDDPYYVLIDCGYKPGSQAFLDHGKSIGDVVKHLHAACGGHLDLAILTHEHQDHLNGIWKSSKPYFETFEIEETWVAWTEDPKNDLAKDLRKRHRDQLLGLLAARRELALAVGENDAAVTRLDSLLGLELGAGAEKLNQTALLAAAGEPEKSVNKQAMKLIKDKGAAKKGCFFRYPGLEPLRLDGTAGVRAYILGPPESADLIADEDPREGEGFPQGNPFSLAGAARRAPTDRERDSPFRRHFYVPLESAFTRETGSKTPFFVERYGVGRRRAKDEDVDGLEVPDNASWRRIDDEWLYSAETLALKLNTGINNTSLVVAFELPRSKKVLFFAGDAQRGNWASWKDVTFKDGTETVTAKELLARTVLYKVGHHGSHNATLTGAADDAEHPNLAWMGQGSAASEFTAMITAVKKWAEEKNNPPWIHPLQSIRDALESKAQGRVFQTDTNEPEQPEGVSDGEWKKFTDRSVFDPLYFDWTVLDE
jgi:beta-lactamase superfamily II metal-dependent hydrolase